jgi:hypothetical protein
MKKKLKKKSSYQKLKEENALLKKQIYAIIANPNGEVAKTTIKMYQVKFGIDKAMWFGSSAKHKETFDGLVKNIS